MFLTKRIAVNVKYMSHLNYTQQPRVFRNTLKYIVLHYTILYHIVLYKTILTLQSEFLF